MNRPVRTRFAPSPTGFLHVGGVRTALFAWLIAKQSGGQFILRIEDTDKAREVEGSEQHIMDSLRWLGLEWDEGPDKAGPHGPYRQSERLDIYKQWAQKLIDTDRAYADPHSQTELEELRDKSKQAKKPFLFRDFRPDNPPAWDGSQPLRFKSNAKDYKWHDEVMGDLSSGPEAIDDFIIIKSDGYPTYNFAHIIDDHLMEVSHVMRSQEFLPSVPKFLNLYEALAINRPLIATLPFVLAPDGKRKLSKRDGAKDILDYQSQGYLPEALVSFMATMGWNDGTTQEIFTIDELKEKFDLNRVHNSGAEFDEQRLEWINGKLLREMDINKLYDLAEPFWPSSAQGVAREDKLKALALVQDRLKYLSELPALTNFLFEEPTTKIEGFQIDPKNQIKRSLNPKDNVDWIRKTIAELSESDFSPTDLGNRLNKLLDDLDTSPPILFQMISIAITGLHQYPPLPDTLSVLGKEKSIERLRRAAGLDA